LTSRPIHRFDGFVLDVARRELRRGSEIRTLQPQVFDFLAYLVEHRERVVSKAELLEQLWPGTKVTDASLQRAVSHARQALAEASKELIETHARRGYRFVGTVDGDEPPATESRAWPPPRFVETPDGLHLAWRSLGDERADATIVLVPGWAFPMAGFATHEVAASFVERLARDARVILFDRRGVGLSDRVKTRAALAERAHDLAMVLDAAGVSERGAVVVGFSEGAPVAAAFAAEHPARVRGLVLVGAFVRMVGHAAGWSDAELDALRTYAKTAWGTGTTVLAMFPTRNDDALRRWAADIELTGASPGAALDLLDMNAVVDARDELARVTAPAIVLHHRDDRVIRVENGREVARSLRDVRYVEASGSDHVFLFEDSDVLLSAIQELAARSRSGSSNAAK
jgi:pimeloyl-ACP methyl ester carboxylesterase/DNA-binding winged helix-turn-helix (wHTH) protein